MLNKRMFLTLVAASLLIVVAQSGYAAEIDVTKSKVNWLGTKVTGQHDGSLALSSGDVVIKEERIESARLVFDMTSIRVLDIKDPKKNGSLERHLKADDFFGVDKYPEAVFILRSATPLETAAKSKDANWRFVGDLTIKGITHTVSFDARVDSRRGKYEARGTVVVDRTKYGITYKSGSVFDAIGNKAIHDEFTITFEVVTR